MKSDIFLGLALLAAAPPAETAEATGHGITLTHYLLLGALLFVCGAVCMATKRNAIGVLMGVELVLNGATINFVAFAHFNRAFEVEGQVFALFVIVLAAAEAAVALAIVLNFYNNHTTVDVDTAEDLKG
jgi:NADH-quinone oxidoreductase subunit K